MKGLAFTDLHYNKDKLGSKFIRANIEGIEGEFDFVLLGGDNADIGPNFEDHRELFSFLRKKFVCPIGFVAGNHDLWGNYWKISSTRLLREIYPRLANEYGLTYLENEDIELKDGTLVGTYGHYDFSLKGRGVTLTELLEGKFAISRDFVVDWKDPRFMDWEGLSAQEVCNQLLDDYEHRSMRAERPLFSISHTVPGLRFNGFGFSEAGEFCQSYSGSNRLEKIIGSISPVIHFCGHTHKPSEGMIGQTKVYNLGSNKYEFRYAKVDTSKENPVELVNVPIKIRLWP
jgi:hypothetical protein